VAAGCDIKRFMSKTLEPLHTVPKPASSLGAISATAFRNDINKVGPQGKRSFAQAGAVAELAARGLFTSNGGITLLDQAAGLAADQLLEAVFDLLRLTMVLKAGGPDSGSYWPQESEQPHFAKELSLPDPHPRLARNCKPILQSNGCRFRGLLNPAALGQTTLNRGGR